MYNIPSHINIYIQKTAPAEQKNKKMKWATQQFTLPDTQFLRNLFRGHIKRAWSPASRSIIINITASHRLILVCVYASYSWKELTHESEPTYLYLPVYLHDTTIHTTQQLPNHITIHNLTMIVWTSHCTVYLWCCLRWIATLLPWLHAGCCCFCLPLTATSDDGLARRVALRVKRRLCLPDCVKERHHSKAVVY